MPLNMERMASAMRGYRVMARYTQDEAAQAVNISRVTLSSYENGAVAPQVDIAWALAELYGVSLDELVGYRKEES